MSFHQYLPSLRSLMLGLIILINMVLFAWGQAYISGRFIPKDVVVPILALTFAWGVMGLLAHKHWFIVLRVWAVLVAVTTAASLILFEYYFSLGIHLTLHDIGALMQTNLHEASGFMRDFMISPWSIASFGASVLLVLYGAELLVHSAKEHKQLAAKSAAPAISGRDMRKKRLRAHLVNAGLFVCLLGTVICCLELSTVKYTRRYVDMVNHALAYVAAAQPLKEIKVAASKKHSGELYVLVIGESQNRDFMGLYNDAFDTTPQLEVCLQPSNSVVFTQVHSCFTHTVPAVAYALSNQLMCQLQSANIADIFNPDFVPISAALKGAKVHSWWLSNQSAQGLYSTDTTLIARTFDDTKFMTQSEYDRPKFDEVLLPEFEQILGSLDPKRNNVVVIHLMGNHALYPERYPQSFAKYQPEQLTAGKIGWLAQDEAEDVASYLNATFYNDYVLAKLIAAARAHPSFMGLLFFSDHGEHLPYQHNFSTFHYGMTHIPLIFTFSQRYAQRYGAKVANLRARSSEFFVSDRIYDLFLDLMDIKSTILHPELSLASSEFQPLTAAAAVLPEGQSLWLDSTLQVIRQIKLQPKLRTQMAVLRCNSDQKMAQVASLGVAQVEVDVAYDDASGLCLNHDQCEVGDLTLAAFLAQHRLSLTRLWLDLKESAADNGEKLLAELEALDAQYDLKSIVVVESTEPKLLKLLSVAGWQGSLHLSDELWEEWDAGDTKVVGRELQSLINDFDLTALSCDSIHFAAIQSILQERNLLPALKLYVRAPEVDLSRADIAAQIAPYQQSAMILVPFESYFDY